MVTTGDVKSFLCVFKRRLLAMFTQEWTAGIRDKERYVSYRCFKKIFEAERYLSDIDIFCFRVALAQLWLGVLLINNNLYRYSDCPTNRNRVFCPDIVENEDHFLLVSPLYTDLRNIFLEQKGAQSLHVTMERYKTFSSALKVYFSCYEQKKTIYI